MTVLTGDSTPFSGEIFLELGCSFYQFGFGMISLFFGCLASVPTDMFEVLHEMQIPRYPKSAMLGLPHTDSSRVHATSNNDDATWLPLSACPDTLHRVPRMPVTLETLVFTVACTHCCLFWTNWMAYQQKKQCFNNPFCRMIASHAQTPRPTTPKP